jgi:hypothetical protein
MSSNKPVVFCRDCRFSEPDQNSPWSLRCHNPEVNRHDSWALASSSKGRGSDCQGERKQGGWFAVCGIEGKKYEVRS